MAEASWKDINLRELCPWLAVFRSFELARDFKKISIAVLGILAMSCGWFWLSVAFERVIAPKNALVRQEAASLKNRPWSVQQWRPYGQPGEPAFAVSEQMLQSPLGTLWELATNWRFVTQPIRDFVDRFKILFYDSPGFGAWFFALLCSLWAAAVWAVCGGAITRIAALELARDERLGLRDALRFSLKRFLSYFGGPVIPLLFIAGISFFCFLGGLVSCIPGFGPLFAGVLWFLPLIAGFLMALIVIGWGVGWPLMFPTISFEGSDALDAVSRAYAYVFQRPWRFLFYSVAAVMFGSICMFFVVLCADLLIYLAKWSVDLGANMPVLFGAESARLTDKLAFYAPAPTGWSLSKETLAPSGVVNYAALFSALWLYLVFTVVLAFLYSYFWSAATVIYGLLRKDVDNIDMDEVYSETEAGTEPDYGTSAFKPEQPTPAATGTTQPAESAQTEQAEQTTAPETGTQEQQQPAEGEPD